MEKDIKNNFPLFLYAFKNEFFQKKIVVYLIWKSGDPNTGLVRPSNGLIIKWPYFQMSCE